MTRVKVHRQTYWLGNGFGSETVHTAWLGGTIVGEWRSGSLSNWAGPARGAVCSTYRQWREQLKGVSGG